MEFCLFLRSVMFVVRFLGRLSSWARCFSVVTARGVRVAAFFLKKLAPFLAFVVKVGIVTTEAPQSKKLRAWNGIFYEL